MRTSSTRLSAGARDVGAVARAEARPRAGVLRARRLGGGAALRLGEPLLKHGLEHLAVAGPPAQSIERQKAAAVGRQRPRERCQRLLVYAPLPRPPAVDDHQPAQRVDAALRRVRAAERALRRRQRLVLRAQPRGRALTADRWILPAAGLPQGLERPAREARIGDLLLRQAGELPERLEPLERVRTRAPVRPLPDPDQRLHERRHVVQRRGMLPQRRPRGHVAGIARGGLDPRLDGAIRAGERPGVEP